MVAIMPAQVKKPKQKPSVEGTVGKIASAIIAKLRNIRFISLSHVEEEIFKALKEFNDAPLVLCQDFGQLKYKNFQFLV